MIHTRGVRVMLGKIGLVQLSNREPQEVLEQRSGLMKLMSGVRSLGVTISVLARSSPYPAPPPWLFSADP